MSHDFYYAFMGIASRRQDLRVLKQLAMNSIKYSAATSREKEMNLAMWQVAWDKFIDQQIISLKL